MSDVPMMELVGHAVAVNPDSELSQLARRKGWPVVVFAQRSRMVIRRTSTITFTLLALVASYAFGMRRGRRT